jgi:hypothetical protein
LELTVPLGESEADREVRVTIEPAGLDKETDKDEWRKFVLEMAGAWQGEFERPEQGEYEQRDPLP